MPKHFPHIQKTIYHEGIYPLGYDAAHLQHSSTADGSSFSLGANNPLSITRVPISMSPHLPCPSPPLPLRMTVIKSFIHQSCLRYSNWSITRAEGCSVREAVLLRVGLNVPRYRTWMSVHQPHALTWVYTLCFFSADKETKSNQLGLILLRGREEKEREMGWHTSDPHKAAVQAAGQVATAKQHVLLRAESEDVEVKSRHYFCHLATPKDWISSRSELGDRFVQVLARSPSLQWQIAKGFLIYSLGLSIKLLNANFFLSDTCTQVPTPHLMSTTISVIRETHFILNCLPISNTVTMNT